MWPNWQIRLICWKSVCNVVKLTHFTILVQRVFAIWSNWQILPIWFKVDLGKSVNFTIFVCGYMTYLTLTILTFAIESNWQFCHPIQYMLFSSFFVDLTHFQISVNKQYKTWILRLCWLILVFFSSSLFLPETFWRRFSYFLDFFFTQKISNFGKYPLQKGFACPTLV